MKQFILFFFIAGVAALINIVFRFIFSNVLNMEFNIAVSISYILGMLFNYTVNKQVNFRSSNRHIIREVYSFFIVSIFGLILVNLFSAVLLNLFTSITTNLKYTETYSHILAVGFVGIYSFFAHKYLTFKDGIVIGLKKLFSSLNNKD